MTVDPTLTLVAGLCVVLVSIALFVLIRRTPFVLRGLERRIDSVEQAETSDTLKKRLIVLENSFAMITKRHEEVRSEMNERVDPIERRHTKFEERLTALITRENARQDFIKRLLEGTK